MTIRRIPHLLAASALIVVLAAACTPSPGAPGSGGAPGTVPGASPVTTAAPAAPTTTYPATPRYVLGTSSPMGSYTVTFMGTIPTSLRNAVITSMGAASSASGVTLNLGGVASNGTAPVDGEIRVRVGTLCNIEGEAGCAQTWGFANRIYSADISIAPIAIDQPYLLDATLHEFGHALGLKHVDPRGGAVQIMGNDDGRILGAYQDGDRAGLAASRARGIQQGIAENGDRGILDADALEVGGHHH